MILSEKQLKEEFTIRKNVFKFYSNIAKSIGLKKCSNQELSQLLYKWYEVDNLINLRRPSKWKINVSNAIDNWDKDFIEANKNLINKNIDMATDKWYDERIQKLDELIEKNSDQRESIGIKEMKYPIIFEEKHDPRTDFYAMVDVMNTYGICLSSIFELTKPSIKLLYLMFEKVPIPIEFEDQQTIYRERSYFYRVMSFLKYYDLVDAIRLEKSKKKKYFLTKKGFLTVMMLKDFLEWWLFAKRILVPMGITIEVDLDKDTELEKSMKLYNKLKHKHIKKEFLKRIDNY